MPIFAIVADSPLGLHRQAVAGNEFPLLRQGLELSPLRILRLLKAACLKAGRPARMILPLARGLDKIAPELGPRDLFQYLGSPSHSPTLQAVAALEARWLEELRRGVASLDPVSTGESSGLLELDTDEAFKSWSATTIADEDVVVLARGSQSLLNTVLSAGLLAEVLRRDALLKDHGVAGMAGHAMGLTPLVLSGRAWKAALATWNPADPRSGPAPVAELSLSPLIEQMATQGIDLHWRSAYHSFQGLFLTRYPEADSMEPGQILAALRSHAAQIDLGSGRRIPFIFNERVAYWGDGSNVHAPKGDFRSLVGRMAQEEQLLRQTTGMVFKGQKILEVGCGPGESALGMMALGAARVTATDFAVETGLFTHRRMLALWPENLPKPGALHFTDAAAEHLPFPDASFDLIYSTQVLEHVRDVRSSMHEILRVLRKGGALLLHYNPYFHLRGGHGVCTTDIPWGHLRLTPEEMEEFVSKVEFPERGRATREALASYFNPERLTLSSFEAILATLPATILHYTTQVEPRHQEFLPQLLPEILARHSGATHRDLITRAVTVVLRKQ
ncbi:MAG: class I SAM-dependent methyltransferase [Planctomycetota bacterium]